MNGLMVLCLAAVAIAAPEYDYQHPVSSHHSVGISESDFGHGSGGSFGSHDIGISGGHGHGHGFSGGSSSSFSGFSGSVGGGSHGFVSGGHASDGTSFSGSFSHGGGGIGFSDGGGAGFGVGSSGAGFSDGGFSGSFGQSPIITKQFYLHSAPEDHSDSAVHKTITVGVPRRNYRVVFIKAPSQSHNSARITVNQAPNEEKTVIYVLAKKTDASDIHADLVEAPHATSKPEVFFIKYKTQEEAAHAQRQIQAQYDSLGGSSHVSDEGFAPVSSVIGSVGHGGAVGDSFGHGGSSHLVSHGVSGAGDSFVHGGSTLVSHGDSIGHGVSHGTGIGSGYLPPN